MLTSCGTVVGAPRLEADRIRDWRTRASRIDVVAKRMEALRGVERRFRAPLAKIPRDEGKAIHSQDETVHENDEDKAVSATEATSTAPSKPKRVVVVRTKAKPDSKPEKLHVVRVRGDGKCLFRAIAIGLAADRGMALAPQREDVEADQLRLAVADAMCRTQDRRAQFPEALDAIEAEDTLPRYCKRLVSETEVFWGGEPEMLVLSKMLNKPIAVYVPGAVAGRMGRKGKSPYVPIQVYGGEYRYKKDGSQRGVLRLLFNGTNHYDLLVEQ